MSAPANLPEYGLEPVDRQATLDALKRALDPLTTVAQCEFLEAPATTGRVAQKLEGGFHILHIVGHGYARAGEPARLVLEDTEGKADFVDEGRLAELFQGDHALRLVTLIACHGGANPTADPFGGLAGRIVEAGAPAVIAMTRAISMPAAALFSEQFYRRLAQTGIVDVAIHSARFQLHEAFAEASDWSTPALFTCLSDGMLWDKPEVEFIEDEIEDPDAPEALRPIIKALVENLDDGKVVPIIGPGVTRGLLPSADDITAAWLKDLPPGATYEYVRQGRSDLPRTAKLLQIATIARSPLQPHDSLVKAYKKFVIDRGHLDEKKYRGASLTELLEVFPAVPANPDIEDPHRILGDLPIKTYLTANYDPLLYLAVKRGRTNGRARTPRREFCRWDDAATKPPDYDQPATVEAPTVFHLFGVDSNPGSMVLTEDDYLEYIRNVSWRAAADSWRIPSQVQLDMTESTLLFLGFRAFDSNFRAMFKAVILNLGRRQRGRFAVLQVEPPASRDEERRQLRQFLAAELSDWQVQIVWSPVHEFLSVLKRKAARLGIA